MNGFEISALRKRGKKLAEAAMKLNISEFATEWPMSAPSSKKPKGLAKTTSPTTSNVAYAKNSSRLIGALFREYFSIHSSNLSIVLVMCGSY